MEKNKAELKKNMFLINEKTYQSLSSKGFAIKNENNYFLDIYEALFLLEKKKLEITKNENEKVTIKEIQKIKSFDINDYIVYKDLKSKGYIIKSGLKFGFSFRIYDKGIKPGEDHSLWLVEVLNEKDKIKIKDITGKNRTAHSSNKKMIYAIIDSEINITYIENSWKRL